MTTYATYNWPDSWTGTPDAYEFTDGRLLGRVSLWSRDCGSSIILYLSQAGLRELAEACVAAADLVSKRAEKKAAGVGAEVRP